MNEEYTYDEALCSIVAALHTPIGQRKDPELYKCSEIVLNRLIKSGVWNKTMHQ